MLLLEIFLALAAVAVLVPASVLFVQVFMAMFPGAPRLREQTRRPNLAVIVPAHNESLLISDTLRTIAPQLDTGDRMLVVADNCTDNTAKIATACGAEVIERSNAERRGKGYALDFGVRYLARRPPEVVLIIDADCTTADGALDRLARACLASGRPVQAMYAMRSAKGAGIKLRTAEFAWLVKNHVRALGFHRLGLPCQLMGSGMAFPWSRISTVALASGHIVEDLKLGLDFARMGVPPLYCPEAMVTSYFPSSTEGIADQRTRWEHGHLGMIFGVAPRLFLEALCRRDHMLLALTLDLCVPPLALLLFLILAVLAGSMVLFATARLAFPLWLASSSFALFAFSVLLAWGSHGRRVVSCGTLALAPFYALRKLPLYLKFLVKRQSKWVRSRRDGD